METKAQYVGASAVVVSLGKQQDGHIGGGLAPELAPELAPDLGRELGP